MGFNCVVSLVSQFENMLSIQNPVITQGSQHCRVTSMSEGSAAVTTPLWQHQFTRGSERLGFHTPCAQLFIFSPFTAKSASPDQTVLPLQAYFLCANALISALIVIQKVFTEFNIVFLFKWIFNLAHEDHFCIFYLMIWRTFSLTLFTIFWRKFHALILSHNSVPGNCFTGKAGMIPLNR